MSKSKLVRTTVLVDDATYAALREFAATARRPLSWEIRYALEEYVRRAQAEAA